MENDERYDTGMMHLSEEELLRFSKDLVPLDAKITPEISERMDKGLSASIELGIRKRIREGTADAAYWRSLHEAAAAGASIGRKDAP